MVYDAINEQFHHHLLQIPQCRGRASLFVVVDQPITPDSKKNIYSSRIYYSKEAGYIERGEKKSLFSQGYFPYWAFGLQRSNENRKHEMAIFLSPFQL